MKIELELYAYRRHLRTCHFFGRGGRDARQDKCNCPYHVDGLHGGQRYRQSLNTRSRQAADRKVSELVRKLDAEAGEADCAAQAAQDNPAHRNSPSQERTISEAVDRFLRVGGVIGPDGKFRGDLEYGTWRKYRNSPQLFTTFCDAKLLVVRCEVRSSRRLPGNSRDWRRDLESRTTDSEDLLCPLRKPSLGPGESGKGYETATQHQAE